jgi:putative tryptophan/tyrosine transport system substrate-binding protein
MRRRTFIAGLGSAVAWPLAARAQPKKMLRIGMAALNPRDAPVFIAFEKRMRELGYNEGSNLTVEFLTFSSPAEYLEADKELLQRHVDIIIAVGDDVALKSAMAVTSKLPIVMVAIDFDPFALGYVSSLAHPTGNVTGVFFQEIELSAKRLEIAKEMVPGLQSAAVFWDSTCADQWQSLKNAGQNLGIRLFGVEMRD